MRLFKVIAIVILFNLVPLSVFATMNSLSTTFQIWNSLDDCHIHIQEVPMIVSGAIPENQIIAVAKPTKPLQITGIPVSEINVAVLCNFKISCEYVSKGNFEVIIDGSKAYLHLLVENISLIEISEMLKTCVIKVIEKGDYGLPEKPYIFTIKTFWTKNDKKNSIQVVQGVSQ